jgi:hypothetical protein
MPLRGGWVLSSRAWLVARVPLSGWRFSQPNVPKPLASVPLTGAVSATDPIGTFGYEPGTDARISADPRTSRGGSGRVNLGRSDGAMGADLGTAEANRTSNRHRAG